VKTKMCVRCEKEFPATVEYFHLQVSGKYLLRTECKQCRRTDYKEYRKSTSGKAARFKASSKYRLGHNHSITSDDYNKMFTEQKGCCAICGCHQSKFERRLAVDHDHKTLIIRGLLCGNCNLGLGLFNDDVALFQRVIEYLKVSNLTPRKRQT
jgi:hypothetical protein